MIEVPPENRDGIQSSKCCVLSKKQDRNTIFILIYHHKRLAVISTLYVEFQM
jgi:hypothetical protein